MLIVISFETSSLPWLIEWLCQRCLPSLFIVEAPSRLGPPYESACNYCNFGSSGDLNCSWRCKLVDPQATGSAGRRLTHGKQAFLVPGEVGFAGPGLDAQDSSIELRLQLQSRYLGRQLTTATSQAALG